MAWSDPKNKSFFTTGWQLCLIGVFLLLLGTAFFTFSSNNLLKMLGAAINITGWLGILAAVIVWIAKGIEKSTKKYGR